VCDVFKKDFNARRESEENSKKKNEMWARKARSRAEGLGFLFFRERVMIILQRRWFSFRSLSLVRSFCKTTTLARCLSLLFLLDGFLASAAGRFFFSLTL
jgi:hypothetical protein